MEEGILSLRWNNHRSTFFHVLSTLHRKELYSDVTLACDGKFFPVHKMVLSVCSEYFEEMFKQTDCKHPIIVLKDILHDDLEALLNYMYAGEANVVQSDLARLIKSAECLRIKGLAVPDEAPHLSDSKRPHTDSHRDESHHSKRRKHDDHSISSSKSNQSYTRERQYSVERESNKDTNDTDIVASGHQIGSHRGNSGPNAVTQHHHSSSPNSNMDMDMGRCSREENSGTQDLAEVVLEEETVIKEEIPETKHEHEDEITRLTDSEASINYDPLNSVDDKGGTGGMAGMFSPQIISSHPQNVLQDIMVQGVPGPSALPAEALAGWDAMTGFSLEGLPSDESRSAQAMESAGLVGLGHPCPFCGKSSFRDQSDLRRHIRIHTGERPYGCPRCPYTATRNEHLAAHLRRKHAVE